MKLNQPLPNDLQFLQQDRVMAQLVSTYQLPPLRQPESTNLFAEVVASIIGQQLSVKVADVIEQRVLQLLPNQEIIPEELLSLDPETIRACGVSYAKISYMRSAAQAAISGDIDFNSLPQKSDQEVIDELTTIHGVGKWTAEMLLIFSLGRPDIFSVGDLGLRTAVSRLYDIERTNLPAIAELSQQWSPYRSTASRLLWKSLDNSPK